MSALFDFGIMLKAYDQMSSVVDGACNKSISSLTGLQSKMKSVSDASAHFGRQSLANGLIAGEAILKPLEAFADLETATTDLKISLMDNLGQIPKQFDAISKQAVELGNILPGTTADFMGVARALQEQGTGMDSIMNGGLKAASYLSVLLKIPGHEAGEMVAKLRESYGLADNELEKMADLVQKARYAFGMTPEEIKIASSYSGATQNILGLKGLDNAKKLLSLQGLGAGVSLEGSSWGTNFSMLLNQTAAFKDKLEKNSKPMRQINEELKQYGINLEFFNHKGQFAGLDNMVKQLEKTKVMTQEDQLNLFKRMFGTEAGRPAAIIANAGMAGYEAAQAKMEKQASLQQRIQLSLGTLKNTWEAFTGTMTNVMAAIGDPLAGKLMPYIQKMNSFVGDTLMPWIDGHKRLVAVVGASVLVFAVLAVTLGALGLAVGAITSGLGALLAISGGIASGARAVWAAFQFVRPLAVLLGGALVNGLKMALVAVRALSIALVTTPFGWVVLGITAVAAAAFLIYKNWGAVKGFFAGIWAAYVAGVNRANQAIDGFIAKAAVIATSIGKAVSQCIAWLAKLGQSAMHLASDFYNAGVNMMMGLWNGIKSKATMVIGSVKDIGSQIASTFKGVLGIHSPSAVFAGFGANITEGARLGIVANQYRAVGAAANMANAMHKSATILPFKRAGTLDAAPVHGGARGMGGASGHVIHFSPTIHVQGGNGNVQSQVVAGLKTSQREFEMMLDRVLAQKERRKLA